MKAHLNGTVTAEAAEADLVRIEGNRCFPPANVDRELLTESPAPCTADRAWAYPTAIDRVGKDSTGHAAFWKEVQVAA